MAAGLPLFLLFRGAEIHFLVWGYPRSRRQGAFHELSPDWSRSVFHEPVEGVNSAGLLRRKPLIIKGLGNGGQGWIRTSEVRDSRFTVCPVWPLRNLPMGTIARREVESSVGGGGVQDKSIAGGKIIRVAGWRGR